MKRTLVFCCLFLALTQLFSLEIIASKRKVLFIGNSYTATNNLPLMVSQVAISEGDTLIFDSNAISSYTLKNHFENVVTRAKIAAGGWDVVIIQAQSQEPAFPEYTTTTLPYALKLDSLINKVDSCTETMFYMTWGRKNGDLTNCASLPEICTYNGMQNLLSAAYLNIAKSAKGSVAPVGEVWRKFRAEHPSIELYNPDESHPIVSGTYLAAVVFYQSIFRKSFSTTGIFKPVSLADTTASFIRSIAQTLIQDSSRKWSQYGRFAKADFGFQFQNNTVSFENTSYAATGYSWDFGDGSAGSDAFEPQHTYQNPGTYSVLLHVTNGCKEDSIRKTVILSPTSTSKTEQTESITIHPNPFTDRVFISESEEIETVSLTDLSGKIQKTGFADGILHTEKTQMGMYMVTVRWKDGRISNRKVLKM
jgi:PKD repeat protein